MSTLTINPEACVLRSVHRLEIDEIGLVTLITDHMTDDEVSDTDRSNLGHIDDIGPLRVPREVRDELDEMSWAWGTRDMMPLRKERTDVDC